MAEGEGGLTSEVAVTGTPVCPTTGGRSQIAIAAACDVLGHSACSSS